jgi:hypothetical protein
MRFTVFWDVAYWSPVEYRWTFLKNALPVFTDEDYTKKAPAGNKGQYIFTLKMEV